MMINVIMVEIYTIASNSSCVTTMLDFAAKPLHHQTCQIPLSLAPLVIKLADVVMPFICQLACAEKCMTCTKKLSANNHGKQ